MRHSHSIHVQKSSIITNIKITFFENETTFFNKKINLTEDDIVLLETSFNFKTIKSKIEQLYPNFNLNHIIPIFGKETVSLKKEIIKKNNITYFLTKPVKRKDFITTINNIKNKDHQQKITEKPKNKLKQNNNRILVAEDNEINRKLIKSILEKMEYKIFFAINGKEAVEIYKQKQNQISLILMDVQMPKMDGYEATIKIRNFDKNIPIFAMTAYATKIHIEKATKSGMNGYITKPFKYKELKKIIEKNFVNIKDEINDISEIKTEKIDFDRFEKETGLEKDDFLILLNELDEQYETLFNDFIDILEKDDKKLIKTQAHTLKGLFLNLRMDNFAKHFKNIEENYQTISKNNILTTLKSIKEALHKTIKNK